MYDCFVLALLSQFISCLPALKPLSNVGPLDKKRLNAESKLITTKKLHILASIMILLHTEKLKTSQLSQLRKTYTLQAKSSILVLRRP